MRDNAIMIPMMEYTDRVHLRRTDTNGYLVNAKMLSILSSGLRDTSMAI
jgi:hypothetical protein